MEIRTAIQKHEGALRELAREAGVSHSTLIDLRDGRVENPGIRTVAKIEAAIERLRIRRECAPSATTSDAPALSPTPATSEVA